MKDRLIRFLWRRRTAVFLFGPILMLIISKPTVNSCLMALPLIVLGQVIRFWAAGHLRKNEGVVSSGPYGYVRNPLYVGSLLIFLGLCIMVNWWAVTIPLMLVFIAFHTGASLQEEKYLEQLFGREYLDYSKRVPRLLPRLRSAGSYGRFSFKLACRNREPMSALGTLIVVTIFYIRAIV